MKRIWIVLGLMSVAFAFIFLFAQKQDDKLIRKFLMEVPEVSNVEASECWNEELFKLLEQKNYIVVDVIGTLDSDIQSRILEHLRNPIHDGIDVEKIYHDIKASRPQATSVINAVFDALQNSVITSDLEGETYGNYWVVYDVVPNDMVARTLEVAPGEMITVMNNSIHYRVFYKGRFIAGPCIQSTSFEGIQDPEIYILAPTDKVWFSVEGDKLVASTGMYMYDTDCGYQTEMLIDSLGNISLHYVVSEDLMGFQDCFNEIRDTVSLDYLAEHAVLMDFYKEPSSSPEDYAYLFVYCLDNKDECSSEAVSYGLYEVFARYPAKFRELDQFLKQLPVEIEKDIKIRLMGRIAFEASIRDEDQKRPSVDEFMSQFPYFNDPDCRDRYCDPTFY